MGLEALREHVPLDALTTLGVGGSARWLLPCTTLDDWRAGLSFAAKHGAPWWVLGGGSNVIIADGGLPGVVLQAESTGIAILDKTPNTVTVAVDAGVPWDALVAWSVGRGLGGIECLSGIPGMVGSAPIQNIGAYGQEVADVIARVEVLRTSDGSVATWSASECAFGYRDSAWKRAPGDWIVTRVFMRLCVNATPCCKYAQVADAVSGLSLLAGADGLRQIREVVLRLRREKGMVVDPSDPDSRSAGSFFVNPVVPTDAVEGIRKRLSVVGAMPAWPTVGGVKLSAAWLIEHSGMQRGFGAGPVGLSRKHTLALVNRGGATAHDVLAFADEVASRVAHASGVHLQREPVLLGF